MNSAKQTQAHPKRAGAALLVRLGALITSFPGLVAVNLLIAAGLAAMVLSAPGQDGQAPALVLPTISPTPQMTAPLPGGSFSATPSSTLSITPSPSPTPQPSATPDPTPTLPATAAVEGLQGHKQSMPLSCEASSAVDWAAFYRVEIDEGSFFDGLPSSDNPEEGFVGDVFGSWGQIPPEDYGVHAQPVAQRLREFGLQAKAIRHMTLEELKKEVASGNPVIVWVVGHVNRGTPVPYTAADGEQTTVAKFEHTVIVVGYTETKISVVDGARSYLIYQGEFMKSWNVLENQAVVWID